MSLESLYRKLAKKAEKKKNESKAELYLGDTDAGRGAVTGRSITANVGVSRDHASWNIREYKSNPGASRGRGWNGGIRK